MHDLVGDESNGHVTVAIILAQPHADLFGTCIDHGHHLDLVVAFLVVRLVDADGIDPDDSVTVRAAQVLEGKDELSLGRHLVLHIVLVANPDRVLEGFFAPAPAQGFIVNSLALVIAVHFRVDPRWDVFVIELDFEEFAVDKRVF